MSGYLTCPHRDECWNDLNARAIERGAKPGRKMMCGFEIAQTVKVCPRKSRYGSNGTEGLPVQLTIDLAYEAEEAA